MHLFKKNISVDKSRVLKYNPDSIDVNRPNKNLEDLRKKNLESNFKFDRVVAEYTGIKELEKKYQQEEIRKEALKMSQKIQEEAYKEAYKLGLEDGKKKAFEDKKKDIEKEINSLKNLILEMSQIKNELFKKNESHIVQLCFYIGKRLLMREVKENESFIKSIIEKTLTLAQNEEKMTFKLSPKDYDWVNQYKVEIYKELQINSSIKIEKDENINPGGLVLETNYGSIDSTIEQRLNKLEELLKGQSQP